MIARRLHACRISHPLRCFATNSNLSESSEKHLYQGSVPVIGKTKRDPLAVLKALARTVRPTALAPPKELYEDMILYSKSPRKRIECKAARASGYKAAEFVLQRYPQLFPMRKPEPVWPDTEQSFSMETEEDLKNLISKTNQQGAIAGYETLLEKGVTISLETENQLLDLVAYFGTVRSKDEAMENDAEDETSSSESADGSDSSDEEEGGRARRHENTWRMDNYAETLFQNMKEKDSRTYDAMILAVLKHNNPDRAFQLFEKMREQNFQASIFTYNGLIHKSSHVYGAGSKLWNVLEGLIGNMTKAPAVMPNLATYNNLLKLCVLIPDGSEKALQIFRDMKSKGIEPSLGSYSLLLRAEYYRETAMAFFNQENAVVPKPTQPTQPTHPTQPPNNAMLQTVVSHLESLDKLPGLQYISDVKFFNTSMGSALFCQDANVAHRLVALADTNDTVLLGGKRGQFYAAYLVTLSHSTESAEVVYHMYKSLVPSKLIPQNWVYSELFRMLERERLPRLVPRLYEDMKRYRVPVSASTSKGIFAALSRRTSVKNYKQYLEIMLDVIHWMNMFKIPITPHMITQLIRQYCAGGHLKSAWKALEMFSENNFHPTYSSLVHLLDCCSTYRDKEQAVKAFELLAKNGYKVPKSRQSNVFNATQMPLSTRLYVTDLFRDQEELDKRRTNIRTPSTQHTEDIEEATS